MRGDRAGCQVSSATELGTKWGPGSGKTELYVLGEDGGGALGIRDKDQHVTAIGDRALVTTTRTQVFHISMWHSGNNVERGSLS